MIHVNADAGGAGRSILNRGHPGPVRSSSRNWQQAHGEAWSWWDRSERGDNVQIARAQLLDLARWLRRWTRPGSRSSARGRTGTTAKSTGFGCRRLSLPQPRDKSVKAGANQRPTAPDSAWNGRLLRHPHLRGSFTCAVNGADIRKEGASRVQYCPPRICPSRDGRVEGLDRRGGAVARS